ncbi:hydroxyectoine utilization dehydratase EutB (plasmid) [Priestia megaterium]|uniref:threonine ammonia-lyase n=2 Tax=Priestia TaxID=2800373 RepID=A0ABD7X3M4_PRIAR|nr:MULTISPECIES: hydroxyectoine utilization dehydratase EutB [Priestia]AJI20112.1 pyridoxal-phosphate dependent enzyme family protein [Priestia megaterium NBRC 15308 = ATCC 14581]KFM94742.1 pyridoxal-phosphate dependent enzyme family protein [Priestia megaterium]KLV28774.1 threonine dehydratase [Priestia megaterium]KNH17334.1 threonine dehydratase [Priestia megaterium]MDR4231588.1 hydroxyectoine utilization dehydratase EutB [Priestia megaterium]
MNHLKSVRKENELTILNIWEAKRRIASIINRTPLIQSYILSEKVGRPVYLKLENVHEIGAFKVRGAANKILSLNEEEKKRGIATFSTGNHGMAVAYVAKKLGIEAVVCISQRVPNAKVDSLKRLGAKIEIYGDSQDEAGERCYELEKEKGLTVIEPFDDPHIIAGQGTIGLEILEEVPDLKDVIIPLSGGGLLSGIGLALKSNDPSIRITGVSMEHSAVMYESLKVGKPIKLVEKNTLADSLLGGIGLDNKYTFQMVQKYMDDVLLIKEEEISYSMAFMMDKHRMIMEGAAATGVAAVLGNKVAHQEGALAIIISGQNVDLSVLRQLIQNYS